MPESKSPKSVRRNVEGESETQPSTTRSGEVSAADAELETPAPLTSERNFEPGVRAIARKAGAAERRMRFARALSAGTTTLSLALFGGVVTLACAKTGVLHDPRAREILAGLAASPLVVAAVAWLRKLPPMAGAIALDKEAKLDSRLATALTFADTTAKPAEVTPFMRAAILDGVANVEKASPSRAVAIPVPKDLPAVIALAAVVAVIATLEVRTHIPPKPHTATAINAVELNSDDLDALSEFARQLEDHQHSPEMQEAVAQFNKIVEDLKNKKLNRESAFQQMANLQKSLDKQSDIDKKALEEAVKKLGNELKKNDLTKDVGTALEKGDKKDAQKKLKELADKLKSGALKLSDDQKKALAKALKAAAERDKEKSLAQMKEAREKLQADLEKMRQEKEKLGKETPEMEKDRKEKEKELERLDREEQQMSSADRQLEKLDRDMQDAAADIMKDLGLSASDLDSGAEDINKMAEDDMTDEEREELKERLKELHDLLQQGLTPEQQAKLKDFMKKAKGQKSAGKGKGKGKKPGKLGQFDPNGDPSDGSGDQQDDDGDGDGDKPGDGQKWTLGPNGEKIPIPGSGSQPGAGMPGGQGNQPGGEGNQPGGEGNQPGGQQWGVGHDPKLLGKKTDIKSGTSDIQVGGQNAGQGPERSEVILGAADKGFVGQSYKKVYDEYHTVAEDALKHDEIPAGYRFYVRRYFDLIRPRE